jgi:pyruvate dehydrogenase E1 component alpha subunit/2-oxoisovalerate dehydrogenase E1 component alpha subunit
LLAVYKVLRDAFVHARAGKGPFFVEAVTYRMGAHTTSDDPKLYRSDDEVLAWAKKDPIDRMRRYLETRGLMDAARDRALEEEASAEILRVIKEVEDLPAPSVASMFDDVYRELPWNLREQREALEKGARAPKH